MIEEEKRHLWRKNLEIPWRKREKLWEVGLVTSTARSDIYGVRTLRELRRRMESNFRGELASRNLEKEAPVGRDPNVTTKTRSPSEQPRCLPAKLQQEDVTDESLPDTK